MYHTEVSVTLDGYTRKLPVTESAYKPIGARGYHDNANGTARRQRVVPSFVGGIPFGRWASQQVNPHEVHNTFMSAATIETCKPTQLELDSFSRWIELEYQRLHLVGVKWRFVDYDPYHDSNDKPSSKIMRESFARDGYLLISTLNSESATFGEGTNVLFRALHDYYHCVTGGNFRFNGEVLAVLPMLVGAPNNVIQDILFSEVIGQSAYYLVTGTYLETQYTAVRCWDSFLRSLYLRDNNARGARGASEVR